MEAPLSPPPLAEALLERTLPNGVLGLSILGDLRQEFDELSAEGRHGHPRLWYWRSALSLAARYSLIRANQQLRAGWSGTTPGVEMITSWMADLRFGVRMLLRTPGMSLIAILTMGLGIALTAHTFSTVYGTVLRGVPVPGADRLVHIHASRLDLGIEQTEPFTQDARAIAERQTAFEDVATFDQRNTNLAGEDAPPERFAGAFLSANAFDLIGIPPAIGRTFVAGEDLPDAAPVVVLGHHVWTNRFASDPEIVGKVVRIDGRLTEVIGVMPEGFRFPFLEDVWLPHRVDLSLPRGDAGDVDVFARLREGVSPEAASAELETIAAGLARDFPESNLGRGLALKPYVDEFMPPEITAIMWVMLVATIGVLLIACANVANLLLARASVRAKEVAVRTALGASRYRVIRQLLAESMILAILGGLIGVVLAWAGVWFFNGWIADIYKPYWIDIRLDRPVLAFSVAITALAALAAGAVPAARASGVRIGEVLKDEARGSSSLRLGRFSSALVISEIAVSCGLLIAAGFLIKSVVNVGNVELGFETEGVAIGRVSLPASDYPTFEARDQFFERLQARLSEEPGVVSASLGSDLPGMGAGLYFLGIEGEAYPTDRDYPVVNVTTITHDYFATFGVDPSQGRGFTRLEAGMEENDVAVVNESFAQRYLGDGSALGRRFRLGLSDSTRPWLTVVGVVPDMHVGGEVGGIGNDRLRAERVFLPKGWADFSSFSLAARTDGDVDDLVGRLRGLVAELDSNLPVFRVGTLQTAIDDSTWAFALFGSTFTIFGAAALFLAAVGLYGVMAFSVTQRRQEMGVRMALGADRGSIMGLILRRGGIQLGIGIALGIAIGAAMGQPMRFVLYAVETADPWIYLATVVTLGSAGLLACLIPARAATRTDPVEAIRGG